MKLTDELLERATAYAHGAWRGPKGLRDDFVQTFMLKLLERPADEDVDVALRRVADLTRKTINAERAEVPGAGGETTRAAKLAPTSSWSHQRHGRLVQLRERGKHYLAERLDEEVPSCDS